MAFVQVATVADVAVGSAIEVVVQGKQIGIFNCGGIFYATNNICTHAYAELHEGYIDNDDCTIECPLHGARFDLTTGRALALPAITPIQVYEIQIENEMILVDI